MEILEIMLYKIMKYEKLFNQVKRLIIIEKILEPKKKHLNSFNQVISLSFIEEL